MLIYWDLSDRELDGLSDCIALGLEDASAKAREYARVAYLQLKVKHIRRADKLKAHLQVPIRAKLAKMEEEHDLAEKKKKKLNSSAQSLTELDEETAMDDSLFASAGGSAGGSTINTSSLLTGVVSLQAVVRGSMSRGQSKGLLEDAETGAAGEPAPSAAPAPATKSSLSGMFRKVAIEDEHSGVKASTSYAPPPVTKATLPTAPLPAAPAAAVAASPHEPARYVRREEVLFCVLP
jgi:hypothetical protein